MEALDQLTLHFDQENLLLMNICLAVIMFSVALELSVPDFLRLLVHPREMIVGLLAQVFVLPALTFALLHIIQPTTSVALGMILVSCCPSGNLSNLLSVLSKGNGALSVSLTTVSTLLATITLPLNFYIWTELYLHSGWQTQSISLSFGSLMLTLLTTVLLPLLVGMLSYNRFPSFVQRIRRPLRIVSVVIFLVFIAVAFAANFGYFLSYIHLLLLIVLVHNGAAYAAGYALSAAFRLDLPARKTITLDTGIQNSGLALVIIFNFFSQSGGGMAFVVGWWGIWDMISGLLLAWGLSKLPIRFRCLNHRNHG